MATERSSAPPALERLIALIVEAFRLSGEIGRRGESTSICFASSAGHPYLRLPLQFATSLEERLLSWVPADELGQLREDGEAELREPGRWGTTFTLLQCWGGRAA